LSPTSDVRQTPSQVRGKCVIFRSQLRKNKRLLLPAIGRATGRASTLSRASKGFNLFKVILWQTLLLRAKNSILSCWLTTLPQEIKPLKGKKFMFAVLGLAFWVKISK
jgi:hypothetical protein